MNNMDEKMNKPSLRLNPLSMHVNPELFEKATEEEKAELVVIRQGTSLWKDAMRRFRKNKFAMVALVLIGWLLVRGFRTEPKGAPIRKSAGLSGFGVLSESLIGAFIVLFELVEFDDSIARSISVPVHLVNTLVLLAGLTLTVFWSTEEGVATVESPHRRALIGFGLGMVAIAATGAVAALADTLFPPDSVRSGIAAELGGESGLLTSLKVLHPLFAIAIGIGAVRWIRMHAWDLSGSARLAARIGVFTVGFQLLVGVINVWLLTPIVIQLIHLLLADVLWISWVWLAAALTTAPVRSSALAE